MADKQMGSSSNAKGSSKSVKNAKAAAKVRAVQQQKRQRMQWTVGIVVLVVAGIAVLALAKISTNGSSSKAGAGTTPIAAPASITANMAKVPISTIASAYKTRFKGYPGFKDPVAEDGKPLIQGGKPEVLYMGAQYCPYCAGERWALGVALSKFGTFSGVKMMQSSEGNIPTLSFDAEKYTSKYIAFTPLELSGQDPQTKLEKATDAQMKLLTDHGGSYPFISFGGKYTQSGASLDVQTLVGKKQTDIAKSLTSPGEVTSAANQVNGAAGAFIKSICTLTKGQPGDVCKPFAAN